MRKPKPQKKFRQESFKESKKSIFIVCEGTKSEHEYFNQFKFKKGLTNVEIHSNLKGLNPDDIFEIAKNKKGEYDIIYCVFDRDEHPSYYEVIRNIMKYTNITAINSNPCFEYWLILHFQFTRENFTTPTPGKAAEKKLNTLMSDLGGYNKKKNNIFKKNQKFTSNESINFAKQNSEKSVKLAKQDTQSSSELFLDPPYTFFIFLLKNYKNGKENNLKIMRI